MPVSYTHLDVYKRQAHDLVQFQVDYAARTHTRHIWTEQAVVQDVTKVQILVLTRGYNFCQITLPCLVYKLAIPKEISYHIQKIRKYTESPLKSL